MNFSKITVLMAEYIKAKLSLHKKAKKHIVPQPEALAGVVGKQEYKDMAASISKEAITLVKYKDEGVLPITPEKYKRIMLVYVKGSEGGMELMQKRLFGESNQKNAAQVLCDKLNKRGFDAFVNESPLQKMEKQAKAGQKPGFMDAYRMGKDAIDGFCGLWDTRL